LSVPTMAEPVVDMDFETKYGHLTRPLKEAAACWDIDLKEVMESFIAAQEDDASSMDPSRMLNFAQAGMLVSSTATNYGRKVEHLYTLVYSTLDTMSKGEGKSLASSALMKRMRKRIVGFQEVENGFEILDAQFQNPAKGIDLPATEGVSNGSHITRRVPLLLLPREDSGEKATAGKDGAAGGVKQSANGTDWKTSSCWISETGCLLLDPGFSIYEDRLTRGSVGGLESGPGPLVPGLLPALVADDQPNQELPIGDDQQDSLIPDDLAPLSPPDFGNEIDFSPSSPEEPSSPPIFPPLPPVNVKRSRNGSPRDGQLIKQTQPAVDPFAILDAHAVPPHIRNVKPKPGKCYQAPAEMKTVFDLELGRKMDLFGPNSNLFTDNKEQTRNQISLTAVDGIEVLKDILIVKVREEKRKAAQAARERRKEELRRLNIPFGETSEEEGGGRSPHGRFSVASGRESIASFDMRTSDDFSISRPLNSVGAGQGLVLYSEPTRQEKALHAERERIAGLEKVLETSKQFYDDLMKKKLAEMLGGHDDGSDQSVSGSVNGSQSVAALVAAAGNAVQDKIPELYANIRKWQDNLEPLLEEQTSRPTFDLDDYLVSIIDKLKSSSNSIVEEDSSAISDFLKSVGADDENGDLSPRAGSTQISSFEQLVKGEPKWNVCRLFLSTLILTNNGNVEIFNNDEPEREGEREESPRAGVPATPARPARTPAAKVTPSHAIVPAGGTPLKGSHTYGASHSFQVKLRNADKNLKFAIQDNAAVVSGIIPIITNKDLPAPEPIGDVPFASDSE
jgi:hypothetical protein